MAIEKTALSHNIKYLRKALGLSQEELASRLKIKRSNIAAYESKNVEPRLRIILELARIFDIDLTTFIETPLTTETSYKAFDSTSDDTSGIPVVISSQNKSKVEDFIQKSVRIRKVLEGFKSFYAFRKKGIKVDSPEKEKIIFDIDNFIQLMEHLLNYNEKVISAMTQLGTESKIESK